MVCWRTAAKSQAPKRVTEQRKTRDTGQRWNTILKHRIAKLSRRVSHLARSLPMRFFIVTIPICLLTAASLSPGPVRSNASAQTAAPTSTIRFEDIAAKAGLHFTTENSASANKNQIETMVAGVALLDYDGDGWLDIYLVNGAAIPSLQKDSPKYWNRLYRNNHDGTFTDVTERAGLAGAGYGMGAAVGDF